jgi:phosphoglycerol transferase MdoB-like AlkP superfamily enzyme
MLIRWRVPKTIQWVVKLFFIMLLVFTLFRLSTFIAFHPETISLFDVFPSFVLGMAFDIRWICFLLLPIVLLSYVPTFSPYSSERARKIWTAYLAAATFLIIFFFGADYGHFAYVSTRLNASALNFAEDAKISAEMLWESYPLFWMLLGLVIVGVIFYQLYNRTHQRVEKVNSKKEIEYRRNWYLLVTFCMALGVYGSFSFTPLKRDDAFTLKDNFKAYLALNPLQNFFTTLRFRQPQVKDLKAKDYYPVISDFLQLDKKNADGYVRRIYPGSGSLESRPNVVLVMCESFSMYKSSMSGNPLNTTPYFNELTKEGVFFNRCFTPHFATARGMFATLTGIPDVQMSKFSTRNEESINQHTIINNFEDYNKHYFIGGSSEFNNYRGLVQNINGVQLHEEGSFKSPKVNVWGISDKDLFLEANELFAKETKPFFAIIQTAGNHRPYTISEKDKDFSRKELPQDSLLKYGFLSSEEYNALRYFDYAFMNFIEAAKKQPYFHNTIFVFVGDHGIAGNARSVYPDVWTDQRLSDEHVPLLLYAPSLLIPQLRTEVVSQIDVLPTIAGLIHQQYTNTTLGRNLLDPSKKNNAAFVIYHDEEKIGWVTDSFYYMKSLRFEDEMLYPMKSNQLYWTKAQEKEIKQKASVMVSGFYETAKWMLVNNKKRY